jgi:hypothetical protein
VTGAREGTNQRHLVRYRAVTALLPRFRTIRGMSTKRSPVEEHDRAPDDRTDASADLPEGDPAREQTQAPARGRILESQWGFIGSPWLRDALLGAARRTMILAALLSGLVVAAPARAHHGADPAPRALSLAQAESATRAALAPHAIDAVYCFRATSPDGRSSRRRALCLVAHPAPEGQICRSLVDVKRSRAFPGFVRTRVIAGQFCMRFDPSLSRAAAAAVVPGRALPKSARELARQARIELEATPHVRVLSTTLEWRTERLCDVVYVLRQHGRLVAYAGQIEIDSRGHAHFRGLTGLRRI